MKANHDEVALRLGVAIHKHWHDPKQVAFEWRSAKLYALFNSLDLDQFMKRIGDYMRECFDREPKTRLPQVEDMIRAHQMEINYWQQEM